jgi:hypothetical protein
LPLFGEVLYFLEIRSNETVLTGAMVSLTSSPCLETLKKTFNVIWAVVFTRYQQVVLLDYHAIVAVVALLPFHHDREFFILEEMQLGVSDGVDTDNDLQDM